MSKHDYAPLEALELLIQKLRTRDQELADQVQSAVNAGKDVQEIERIGKKNSRYYRRTVSYSPEEALQVAVDVLKAHFIEQPLFINSCHNNMARAAVGVVKSPTFSWLPQEVAVHPDVTDTEKSIEVEVQTETQLISDGAALTPIRPETLPMPRISDVELQKEQNNLDHLRALVDFTVK